MLPVVGRNVVMRRVTVIVGFSTIYLSISCYQ